MNTVKENNEHLCLNEILNPFYFHFKYYSNYPEQFQKQINELLSFYHDPDLQTCIQREGFVVGEGEINYVNNNPFKKEIKALKIGLTKQILPSMCFYIHDTPQINITLKEFLLDKIFIELLTRTLADYDLWMELCLRDFGNICICGLFDKEK